MSIGEQPGDQPRIRIEAPRRFGAGTLMICSAYGLVLFLPAVFAILAVSLVQLSYLTLVLPLGTLAFATFCLPFGFGNGYVERVARSLRPADREAMLVQLAFVPRLRWGLRGLMEDADDIGWLTCTGSALVFEGDSVNLSVPLSRVKSVRRENSGFRGLFLYSRTVVRVEGLDEFTTLRFAERSSRLLPGSWRLGRKLYECVASKIPDRRP